MKSFLGRYADLASHVLAVLPRPATCGRASRAVIGLTFGALWGRPWGGLPGTVGGRVARLETLVADSALAAPDTVWSQTARMDTTVSPCVNFYRYANGNWLAHYPIARADTAPSRIWGVTIRREVGTFTEVAHHARTTLLQVLDEARTQAATTRDPAVRLVGRFYGSCMADTTIVSPGTPNSADEHTWRCFQATDQMLRPALSVLYGRAVFPAATRARAVAFVAAIHSAIGRRIDQASWLSDSSRTRAREKLTRYTPDLGDDSLPPAYATLELSPNDYVHNQQEVKRFLYMQRLRSNVADIQAMNSKMRPYVVNAAEHEQTATLELPMVLWTPPLFDASASADVAENFGALGMMISHEFMHAFGTTNKSWLAPTDEAAFAARTARLVAQADAYTPVSASAAVNGAQTLEENLADLDGVRVAYDAFMHADHGVARVTGVAGGPHARPGTTGHSSHHMDSGRDWTPEQRFFLAFANFMREKPVGIERPDAHAPKEFRVNGPLVNFPAFARAFGCKDGDPMVRPASQRVEVW